MGQETEEKKQIEQLLRQKKKDTIIKIILIIVIILLLLFYWVGYKIGRIGYQETSGNPSDTVDLIKVTQDNIQITKNTQLNIFENEAFGGEKKIAPHSKGEYQFCIKNETKENIVYHISFLDEKKHLVNMKYKLKIDNVYIRGDKDNYISIENLNVEDVIVTKDSTNIFTLEWYWEDNDIKDTFVGSQDIVQYYTLNLQIEATEHEITKEE